MIDPTKFLPDIRRWEGVFTWMYRDTEGYATTGIGFLVRDHDEALELPFGNMTEERPATPDEIRREFTRVMSCKRGMRAGAYRAIRAPRIELTEGAIMQIARRRLEKEFLPGVRKLLPRFDAFPEAAQSAIVDLAWNLGIGRSATEERKATGLTAFGDLLAACNRGDWATAAKECHVATSREDRNAWRAEMFTAAGSLVA